jgi:hypothetical protein
MCWQRVAGGVLVGAGLFMAIPAKALDAPVGGFQPWMAFTLTDEFKDENADLFFIADNDSTYNPARALPVGGAPIFRVGLLDSGAQISLIRDEARIAFNIDGRGFDGTEFIPLGGVAGTEFARSEDPLGFFATGLQNVTSASGSPIAVNQATLRGQTSVSIASAEAGSALPNVIGLPMVSQYTAVIRNSQPRFINDGTTTYRGPSVELLPLGSGGQGLTRRAALNLQVSPTVGTTQPTYTFNFENALTGLPLTENPSIPTAVAGAFFTNITLANDVTSGGSAQNAEVFFDTGAQVTVVDELLASQLGFDVVLDTPDFIVPVLGGGGTLSQVPGFYADTLTLPAVGGNFVANNVPVLVLPNIPDPRGTGNVRGILGTNVFWDRDIVIDPAGSRLWVSDPVVATANWTSTASTTTFEPTGNWSNNQTPSQLTAVNMKLIRTGPQTVTLSNDTTLNRLALEGNGPASPITLNLSTRQLTLVGEASIQAHATLQTFSSGGVSALQVNVNPDGTLQGSGLIDTVSVNNRGTVAPRSGTAMNIRGDYFQFSEGTLSYLDVMLDVTGYVGLDGTIDVGDVLINQTLGTQRTVVDADRVVGTFDRVLNTFNPATPAPGKAIAVTYSSTQVIATVARPGDADLDTDVDFDDATALRLSFTGRQLPGVAGATWIDGDSDGDGDVDFDDAMLLRFNYTGSLDPALTEAEGPSTLILFADAESGELQLIGNTTIFGLSITSPSGALLTGKALHDDLTLTLADSVHEQAAITLGSLTVTGALALSGSGGWDGASRDLSLRYLTADGAVVSGLVRYVPEPASAAVLLCVMMFYRRR